jgi:hypothetical protein
MGTDDWRGIQSHGRDGPLVGRPCGNSRVCQGIGQPMIGAIHAMSLPTIVGEGGRKLGLLLDDLFLKIACKWLI